ncbi:MAG: alanine--glyoxylate aminotransferase family protein [Bdellovibrionota bacterium]
MFSFLKRSQARTQNEQQLPLVMTPGPVLVPKAIMEAIALPIIHHRTEAFEKDLGWVLENLPKIFKTKERAYIHNSTGSGAMESALVNTVSPGETVLSIVCGKFGERFGEIAKSYGMNVITHNVEWGKSFKTSDIEKLLQQHPEIKAITCQACETSTAVLNPIQELGKVVAKTNAILIVDAITALGATNLDMDAWNLDVVVGGSQKAFMLPTGIAFIAFSKKAWARVETSKSPRYYWDIRLEKKANEKNQTYFSSPVTHIRALKTALEIIFKVGANQFIERHLMIAEALRQAGTAMGLQVYAENPSSTVTAFKLPDNINGEKVQKIMEDKHRITIAGGQDHLKGKIIRIGHMGAIEKEHMVLTLEKLALTLKELGMNIDSGKATAILNEKLKHLKPLPHIQTHSEV